MAGGRVRPQQNALPVVGKRQRRPVLRVQRAGPGGDVRGRVEESGDVEDGEGGFVEVAEVV